MRICLMALLLGLLGAQAFAAQQAHNVYQFDDPVLTQRFQHLGDLLRCPKCQDQSISNSDADIAEDMRERTAELLREGKTNEQIVNYFVARYGDFVTFKPPFQWNTLWLWSGPFVVLLIGLFFVIRVMVNANRRQADVDGEDSGDTAC